MTHPHVAGYAIASPEFWSASGACALKGWLGVPTQQSCDCLCGVNRLAESLLVELCSATLDAESGRDGGEDGDEELNDFATGFFFHDFWFFKGICLSALPLVDIQCLMRCFRSW